LKRENKDYLPLFLHSEDPLRVYIIDNQIIGCSPYGGYESSPALAYDYLLRLNNNEVTNEAIPKVFQDFFKNKKPLSVDKYQFNTCFIGSNGPWPNHCLTPSITIQDTSLPILLHDFILDGLALIPRIEITAYDAFLSFANICTNSLCESLNRYKRKHFIHTLSEELITQEIHDIKLMDNRNEAQFKNQYLDMQLFAFNYLDFLKENILISKTSVYEILRFSGARLLAYLSNEPIVSSYLKDVVKQFVQIDNLTEIELILFYTLLMAVHNDQNKQNFQSEIGKIIKENYETNEKLFSIVEDRIYKKFPR
jgi:hypothetical protein